MKNKTLNILFTALVSMTLIGCGNTNTESNASVPASESVTASVEESKEVVVADPTPAPSVEESKEVVPEPSETLPETETKPKESEIPVESEVPESKTPEESKAPEESKEVTAPTATPAPQPEKQPEVAPTPAPAPAPEPTPAPAPEPTPAPAPAVCTHPNTTQTNNDYNKTISGGCYELHHAWTKTCTNCGVVTETGDLVIGEYHADHHEHESGPQATCTTAGQYKTRDWCDCGANGAPNWVTHDVPASGHHYEEVLGDFENPLQGGRGQQWINKCRDCGDVAGERWDASE